MPDNRSPAQRIAAAAMGTWSYHMGRSDLTPQARRAAAERAVRASFRTDATTQAPFTNAEYREAFRILSQARTAAQQTNAGRNVQASSIPPITQGPKPKGSFNIGSRGNLCYLVEFTINDCGQLRSFRVVIRTSDVLNIQRIRQRGRFLIDQYVNRKRAVGSPGDLSCIKIADPNAGEPDVQVLSVVDCG